MLSIVGICTLLLSSMYALPIAPSVVYMNNDSFTDETIPLICSVFGDLYFEYSSRYYWDDFILKPFAYLCLSAQLYNIRSMNTDSIIDEVQTMKEVYLLDIDNLDKTTYRQIHSQSFIAPIYEDNDWPYVMHISSYLSEDEIFDLLISNVKNQRKMLQDKYTKQYEQCRLVITADTDPSNLSDEEWDCLKLGIKAWGRYYNDNN